MGGMHCSFDFFFDPCRITFFFFLEFYKPSHHPLVFSSQQEGFIASMSLQQGSFMAQNDTLTVFDFDFSSFLSAQVPSFLQLEAFATWVSFILQFKKFFTILWIPNVSSYARRIIRSIMVRFELIQCFVYVLKIEKIKIVKTNQI